MVKKGNVMDCCLHRIVPGATEPLSAPSSSSTFKEGAKTLLNVIKSLPILTLPSIDQEGLTEIGSGLVFWCF